MEEALVYSIVCSIRVFRKESSQEGTARRFGVSRHGVFASGEPLEQAPEPHYPRRFLSTSTVSPPEQHPPAVRDVVGKSARVRVREVGSGKPLLLLHDFLSDHGEWAGVEAPLAARFRLISVDLPGFGESEKPAPSRFKYDFDHFADALVEVAGALDAAPLSVCGHGLGGAIAIALAERHPSMIDRVVLVSPPLFGSQLVPIAKLFALPVIGAVAFKQLVGQRALSWHFRRGVFASTRPATDRLERLFDVFNTPAAREAAGAVLESLRDTRTLEARLARVGSPALVVWGRKDGLAPAGHARRLSRALPDARLELLDCGHSPAEEMPERFAAVALEFLAHKTVRRR
jgi:pimeloyl-ACP methyl ester carboxylesterase